MTHDLAHISNILGIVFKANLDERSSKEHPGPARPSCVRRTARKTPRKKNRKDCCGVYRMDENRRNKPYNNVLTTVLQYICHISLFRVLLEDCLQAPCSRTRLLS